MLWIRIGFNADPDSDLVFCLWFAKVPNQRGSMRIRLQTNVQNPEIRKSFCRYKSLFEMVEIRFICNLWSIFFLLDLDLYSQNRSGSGRAKSVRIHADSDPQNCYNTTYICMRAGKHIIGHMKNWINRYRSSCRIENILSFMYVCMITQLWHMQHATAEYQG